MATGNTGSTITTVDALLKDVYSEKIWSQLNNAVIALEHYGKKVRQVGGRATIVPAHVARNTGVANKSEWGTSANSGGLPSAGSQKYVDLRVTPKYSYGRFSVTGPQIAAMQEGGDKAYVSAVSSESKGLVRDFKNKCNKLTIYGGQVKGFLLEHKASSLTGGAQEATGTGSADFSQTTDGATDTWKFDGDYNLFEADTVLGRSAVNPADTASVLSWIRVKLIRMDTYEEVTEVIGDNLNIFVSDSGGERAGWIKLTVGSDSASDGFTTADVDEDYAIAVLVHETRAGDSAGTPVVMGAPLAQTGVYDADGTIIEQSGILDNLANPTHHTIDRSDSTTETGADVLQSRIVVADGEGVDRAPMAMSHFEDMEAELDDLSEEGITGLWMNRRERAKYFNLLRSHGEKNWDGKAASAGDAGFKKDKVTIGGLTIMVDRHMPRGIVVHECHESWERVEMGKMGFLEHDGKMLLRDSLNDAYEARYAWYWNLCCAHPRANGITVGFDR